MKMFLLPDCSTVSPGAPRLVTGTPSLVACTFNLVTSAPRCSPGCQEISHILADSSPVLLGAPEGLCIGPVISGIRAPWDSGLTCSKHFQRLPVTTIHSVDEDMLKVVTI